MRQSSENQGIGESQKIRKTKLSIRECGYQNRQNILPDDSRLLGLGDDAELDEALYEPALNTAYCLSLNLKCCDCLQRLKFTRHFFFQSIYGNTRTIQGNKFIF